MSNFNIPDMKKITFSLLIVLFATGLFAQEVKDTTYWKKNGDFSLNFSQVSLTNWNAGGKNSVSGVAIFNYAANYLKGKIGWDNSLNLGYGLLKESDQDLIKSEDKLEFNSKAGYKMGENKHWFYSGLFNFRSQFANGYKYPDVTNKISAMFAPAYLTFALGADYKPNDKFSLFLSPLSSKMTIVADDELSTVGAFGVKENKNLRTEFGGTLRSEWKFPIMTNVDAVNVIGLFSNYANNPQNLDVNWDFRINMKINKFLSANLITNMIYDDDIYVSVDRNNDGIYGPNEKGRRVQFKQLFGAGLSYKF